MVSKRIAVIPARGGSKRLPRKNIREFCGRPMIAWTIEAALKSDMFDKVLVSTEDEEIAEISRQAGAEVPFLRNKYYDDHSKASEATAAAIIQAEDFWKTQFDIVAQLMANCPLRTSEDIRNAMDHFDKTPHAFQISAFKYGWMNPWWAMRMRADGTAEQLFPESVDSRSQDLDTLYCPTGAIWIARRDALLQTGDFYGPGFSIWPMPWMRAVDIDDEHDLLMAELLAAMSDNAQ